MHSARVTCSKRAVFGRLLQQKTYTMFPCVFFINLPPDCRCYFERINFGRSGFSIILVSAVKCCMKTTLCTVQSDPATNSDPFVLVLENVTMEDDGWYTCLVGNSVGVSYAFFWLTITTRESLHVLQCYRHYFHDKCIETCCRK